MGLHLKVEARIGELRARRLGSFDQLRHRGEEIGHEAIIGDLEDGRSVLVDATVFDPFMPARC